MAVISSGRVTVVNPLFWKIFVPQSVTPLGRETCFRDEQSEKTVSPIVFSPLPNATDSKAVQPEKTFGPNVSTLSGSTTVSSLVHP